MQTITANLVELEQERILDNIIEGYPVLVHRTDGGEYKIWMEYHQGAEKFFLRFGQYTQVFRFWDSLVNHIRRHTFDKIDFNID